MPQAVEDLEERKTLRKLLNEDDLWGGRELEDLYGWVHRATLAYLASGCDPQALAGEAQGFVGVVRAFFESQRDMSREYVDEGPRGIRGGPPESEDGIAEARREVGALDRLLARLDGQPGRGG